MSTGNIAINAVFNNDFDNIKNMNIDDYKQCDDLGRNAIHAACFKGYSQILIYMLNSFSDSEKTEIANKMDNYGNTPAHYASGQSWNDNINNNNINDNNYID